MVHKSIARIVKFVFVEQSYVLTPVDHKSFNSFISGCRKTSRDLFGWFGPGINMVKNSNSRCMHISGGRLYGVRKTGHNEYCLPDIPNGLNPSVHNPRYTFRILLAKSGCTLLKCFQALASDGWVISPSVWVCSACHLIFPAVCSDWYNLFNLSVIGRYHILWYGTLLRPRPCGLNRGFLQNRHSSSFSSSPQ